MLSEENQTIHLRSSYIRYMCFLSMIVEDVTQSSPFYGYEFYKTITSERVKLLEVCEFWHNDLSKDKDKIWMTAIPTFVVKCFESIKFILSRIMWIALNICCTNVFLLFYSYSLILNFPLIHTQLSYKGFYQKFLFYLFILDI